MEIKPILIIIDLISIFSPFSKVLEKIVHDQMLLFPYQFGFRKGYSTEQTILKMTHSIKTAVDENQATCGVFLDFSKAFHTINRQILLSSLINTVSVVSHIYGLLII